MSHLDLIRKYDIPGPRYTSYPTVPYWKTQLFSVDEWKQAVKSHDLSNGISLYIHLPYCENLCTYCGCTTRITRNHSVELPYIEAVLAEWGMYRALFSTTPEIKEIHLGGGTPTFFEPKNLSLLLGGLLVDNRAQPAISVEAHPNNTTKEHLEVLHHFGARRVSFGIQDFDPKVQQLIHRIQPVEKVRDITKTAREAGYTSVNFDLIYGLPGQTICTVTNTIKETLRLRPDRIAFYSYAHVPWMKPAQKSFESALPSPQLKRQLYEIGKQLLVRAGYKEIGMDHFALPGDELFEAAQTGTLHRNFMGYTTMKTDMALGLGASSISDSWDAFAQNEKQTDRYMQMVREGELPITRGHLLTDEDLEIRQHILHVMCRFTTDLTSNVDFETVVREKLVDMETDDLVAWDNHVLKVTPAGRPFVRNVCMAFDKHLWSSNSQAVGFSRTV
jgi:oxygen-independent coproporphyrinogen III oxidase